MAMLFFYNSFLTFTYIIYYLHKCHTFTKVYKERKQIFVHCIQTILITKLIKLTVNILQKVFCTAKEKQIKQRFPMSVRSYVIWLFSFNADTNLLDGKIFIINFASLKKLTITKNLISF